MNIGDTVTHRVSRRCDRGNYSVLFKADSSFAEVGFHSRRGTETVQAVVVANPGS